MPTYNLPDGEALRNLIDKDDLTADQKIKAIQAIMSNDLNQQILEQLKVLNTYMALITDNNIDEE